MAERLLRPRLGAARLVLAEQGDGPTKDAISKVQADAVVSLVAREPGLPSITDETRASLVDLACAGQWLPADLERIIDALKKQVAVQPAGKMASVPDAICSIGCLRCSPTLLRASGMHFSMRISSRGARISFLLASCSWGAGASRSRA